MTRRERVAAARAEGLETAAKTILRYHPDTYGCRCSENNPAEAIRNGEGAPWEHDVECAAWWKAQEDARNRTAW